MFSSLGLMGYTLPAYPWDRMFERMTHPHLSGLFEAPIRATHFGSNIGLRSLNSSLPSDVTFQTFGTVI